MLTLSQPDMEMLMNLSVGSKLQHPSVDKQITGCSTQQPELSARSDDFNKDTFQTL